MVHAVEVESGIPCGATVSESDVVRRFAGCRSDLDEPAVGVRCQESAWNHVLNGDDSAALVLADNSETFQAREQFVR